MNVCFCADEPDDFYDFTPEDFYRVMGDRIGGTSFGQWSIHLFKNFNLMTSRLDICMISRVSIFSYLQLNLKCSKHVSLGKQKQLPGGQELQRYFIL